MILIEFIYNLSLLVALSIVSGFVDRRYSRHTKTGLIIQGVLFGIVAIVGMMRPLVFSEGLIFDGRSVVLSLAALFFGPVSGIIAGIMALAFRLYQGGFGVLPGSLVIFFSVLIGSIYYEYIKIVDKKIKLMQLLYFGIVVHVVMLLIMFTLPFPEAISVIQRIGLSVIILFPLATVLIGKILSDQRSTNEVSEIISTSEKRLKKSEEFLKETQKIAQLGTYVLDIKTGIWKSSEIMDSIFGIGTGFDKTVKGWISLIHPGWRNIMSDYFVNEVTGLKKNFDKEYKIIRKNDKEERWVHGLGKLEFNENNEPVRMVGTIRDITERKVAEEELRKSRDELQDYFENDISADYVTDLDGIIIDCNKTFLNLFGISDKNNLTKYNIIDFYGNPEDRERIIKEIEKNKRLNNYEVELKTLDNKRLLVLAMTTGVFNDSGKLEKVRGYLVDVTDKKQAEEEYKKLSLAVEQSPASVIITSPKGEIEFVNDKFCEVTGYSKEEVIGKNPRILKSNHQDKGFYTNLWNTILSGKEWSGELQNKKKNGELYWESALISPLIDKNGNITSFIAVKENITGRKLEQEELVKAKEKAEEMNRLKNIFLSNMSHELRTPLIGILGYAEFLAGELKDPNLVEMANIIKNSGKRLTQTLNNILDISKIEAEKQEVDFKKQDLLKHLNEQVKLFKPVAENRNLSLTLETREENLVAYVDENMFISIINNLLSNALKYTEKGAITITASKETENAIIEVKDTGIGMPEEYHELVYEPFRQISEGLNRKYEGTGLGLTLVKKYVDMSGGKITIESKPRKGSIFTLKFLLDKPTDENLTSTK